ncbi:MAG: NAD(+) synthase [Gammaproteobacteria bacterium]|nr:NAD(+) synthase [Gammaproteobacteria bacterium]
MDYREIGLIRVGAVAPVVNLANPDANARHILSLYESLVARGCSAVVTPELSLTGYSCEDLFFSDELLVSSDQSLVWLAEQTGDAALLVGAPIRRTNGKMYNCAIVCANGKVIGAVPKSAIPNHYEYYEDRWFDSGTGVRELVSIGQHEFVLDRNQGFLLGDVSFAIEVCEDLWISNPPSSDHCLNGALIVFNLSASNELISKLTYRRSLVNMQSAKCICGYVYASAGAHESTKDTVYGGHLIASENGVTLNESSRFSLTDTEMLVDIDVAKIQFERRRTATYRSSTSKSVWNEVSCSSRQGFDSTMRLYSSRPFVPTAEEELSTRTSEVLEIQSTGLVRRMISAHTDTLVIGLSGGLDSTLAYLVCLDALSKLGRPISKLLPVTMPGLGTSDHTLQSVLSLASTTGTKLSQLDITEAVNRHLDQICHDGAADLTMENAQARERTKILFDLANMHKGLVVGTGDLSELALGWCTFNGDHMSSYNVNASVPKTLVSHVVRWYSENRAPRKLAEVLNRILDTPISPELVPSESGTVEQQTESILGPFEVHDFFLYHLLRTGATARKLFVIARIAFENRYDDKELKKFLVTFWERFTTNQFKRTVLPAGPKVGTVSLSPRGDWRMPDEVDAEQILEAIREF